MPMLVWTITKNKFSLFSQPKPPKTQSRKNRPYPVRSPFWSRSTSVVECDCCFNHARTIVSLASHFCFTEKWKFPHSLSQLLERMTISFGQSAHEGGESRKWPFLSLLFLSRLTNKWQELFPRDVFPPLLNIHGIAFPRLSLPRISDFFRLLFFCGRERNESKIKRELLNGGKKNHFSR